MEPLRDAFFNGIFLVLKVQQPRPEDGAKRIGIPIFIGMFFLYIWGFLVIISFFAVVL